MAATVKIGLRERKKLLTRQVVSTAAVALFSTRGFHQTSIEELAAAAGIAPRTFFRYFAKKEDTLFADQELGDQLAAAAVGRRHQSESLEEALERMVRGLPVPAVADDALVRRIRLIISEPALLARGVQHVMTSIDQLLPVLAGTGASRAARRRARMLLSAYVGAFLAALLSQVESGSRLDLRAITEEALQFTTRRHQQSAGRR